MTVFLGECLQFHMLGRGFEVILGNIFFPTVFDHYYIAHVQVMFVY